MWKFQHEAGAANSIVFLLQIHSGLISVVGSNGKSLFAQLNIILPWSGARSEGEIQFSSFVHFCLSILDDIFMRNQKLRKQEKPNETNTL